jgi:hypothetical protein
MTASPLLKSDHSVYSIDHGVVMEHHVFIFLPLISVPGGVMTLWPSSVSELESGAERAHHVQQIVVTLPRTVIIVMRYLFAFLNQ